MLGNPDNLPNHPRYLEELGITPTRARIYKIEDDDGYEEDPWLWQLDGYAVVDGRHAVTSTVWNFRTFAEAIAELPDFIRAVTS
jgi:hypothetical protein